MAMEAQESVEEKIGAGYADGWGRKPKQIDDKKVKRTMENLKQNTENLTKFRDALRGCTTFADAEKRLEREGIEHGGKRRQLVAKLAPALFNARMSEAYTGKNP